MFKSLNVPGLETGEMMSLEDEISHLQKENSRIENQLSRMKGDVTSSDVEAVSDDKVDIKTVCLPSKLDPAEKLELSLSLLFQEQNELKRKNAKLTDYYENLRSNVFSIFGSTPNYADSYLGLLLI